LTRGFSSPARYRAAMLSKGIGDILAP
jgi:hypothetical protein